MNVIERIDASTHSSDVHTDSSVRAREIGAGDACVIPRDGWHVVQVIEPPKFAHMAPGLNGDHQQ